MEDLAKAIFAAYEQPGVGNNPTASWGDQSAEAQRRYIRAAEVVSVMLGDGRFRIAAITQTASQ